MLEEEPVKRIAICFWRLRRGPVFEAAFMKWAGEQLKLKRNNDKMMLIGPFADPTLEAGSETDVGRMVEFVLSGPDVLGRLARPEKNNSNEISKLMKELKALQLQRVAKEKRELQAN